jgi:hypothetical protein
MPPLYTHVSVHDLPRRPQGGGVRLLVHTLSRHATRMFCADTQFVVFNGTANNSRPAPHVANPAYFHPRSHSLSESHWSHWQHLRHTDCSHYLIVRGARLEPPAKQNRLLAVLETPRPWSFCSLCAAKWVWRSRWCIQTR